MATWYLIYLIVNYVLKHFKDSIDLFQPVDSFTNHYYFDNIILFVFHFFDSLFYFQCFGTTVNGDTAL